MTIIMTAFLKGTRNSSKDSARQKYWCEICETFVIPKTSFRLQPAYRILSHVLCLVGFCVMPYAVPGCRKEYYYCPNCHSWLEPVRSTNQKSKSKILSESKTKTDTGVVEDKKEGNVKKEQPSNLKTFEPIMNSFSISHKTVATDSDLEEKERRKSCIVIERIFSYSKSCQAGNGRIKRKITKSLPCTRLKEVLSRSETKKSNSETNKKERLTSLSSTRLRSIFSRKRSTDRTSIKKRITFRGIKSASKIDSTTEPKNPSILRIVSSPTKEDLMRLLLERVHERIEPLPFTKKKLLPSDRYRAISNQHVKVT